MGLKEVLEKMKIVQADEDAAPAPRHPAPAHVPSTPQAHLNPPPAPSGTGAGRRGTAAPSMDEVLKSVPPQKIDEKALAAAAREGGGDVPDFDAIYKAAGVKDPVHGFSAYKVLEIFTSAEFASMESKAKASALAAFLKMNPSGPVPVAQIIQDAVARDQALDGFEEFLRKKLEARREELDKENAKLQAEIDALTQRNKEKMDANRRTLEGERERLGNWQARKRIEERKLFDAIAPFVEENPVTLSGSADPGKPAGKS